MRILILNGPNLDLLGTREPSVYGHRPFNEYLEALRGAFPAVIIDHAQSNFEGELVGWLREKASEVDAFVVNPAGYSHTSVALRDAIAVVGKPVGEVHISNIHARESFRQTTITGAVCAGVISGFGLEGYRMAVEHLRQTAIGGAGRA